MKRFSGVIIIALFLLGLGCAKSGYRSSSKTDCRVNPKHQLKVRGNAGCFILSEGKMLIPRHRKTGKLDLPGGTAEKGETSQCTAHRESREEVGASVEVGTLLVTFDNGFRLFECKPLKKVKLKVPRGFRDEISEVLLIDPTKTKAKEWRFPAQQVTIVGIYRRQMKARQ